MSLPGKGNEVKRSYGDGASDTTTLSSDTSEEESILQDACAEKSHGKTVDGAYGMFPASSGIGAAIAKSCVRKSSAVREFALESEQDMFEEEGLQGHSPTSLDGRPKNHRASEEMCRLVLTPAETLGSLRVSDGDSDSDSDVIIPLSQMPRHGRLSPSSGDDVTLGSREIVDDDLVPGSQPISAGKLFAQSTLKEQSRSSNKEVASQPSRKELSGVQPAPPEFRDKEGLTSDLLQQWQPSVRSSSPANSSCTEQQMVGPSANVRGRTLKSIRKGGSDRDFPSSEELCCTGDNRRVDKPERGKRNKDLGTQLSAGGGRREALRLTVTQQESSQNIGTGEVLAAKIGNDLGVHVKTEPSVEGTELQNDRTKAGPTVAMIGSSRGEGNLGRISTEDVVKIEIEDDEIDHPVTSSSRSRDRVALPSERRQEAAPLTSINADESAMSVSQSERTRAAKNRTEPDRPADTSADDNSSLFRLEKPTVYSEEQESSEDRWRHLTIFQRAKNLQQMAAKSPEKFPRRWNDSLNSEDPFDVVDRYLANSCSFESSNQPLPVTTAGHQRDFVVSVTRRDENSNVPPSSSAEIRQQRSIGTTFQRHSEELEGVEISAERRALYEAETQVEESPCPICEDECVAGTGIVQGTPKKHHSFTNVREKSLQKRGENLDEITKSCNFGSMVNERERGEHGTVNSRGSEENVINAERMEESVGDDRREEEVLDTCELSDKGVTERRGSKARGISNIFIADDSSRNQRNVGIGISFEGETPRSSMKRKFRGRGLAAARIMKDGCAARKKLVPGVREDGTEIATTALDKCSESTSCDSDVAVRLPTKKKKVPTATLP